MTFKDDTFFTVPEVMTGSNTFEQNKQKHIDKRPRFNIEVYGSKGRAIGDSGSNLNIASYSLYQILVQNGCSFRPESVTLNYADGRPNEGEVLSTDIEINILGRKVTTKIFATPRTCVPYTLLGVEFMSRASICLNFETQEWYFKDCPNELHPFNPDVEIRAKANDTTQVTSNSETDVSNTPLNVISESTHSPEDLSLREDEGITFTPEERKLFDAMLQKHANTFKHTGKPTSYAEHRINTGNAEPISCQPYVVNGKRAEILRQEIEMLLLDIIEPCESPWASPVVLVKKEDGSVRFCVNYKELNSRTQNDSYPMPRLDRLLHSAKSTKFMSVIDLRCGYWQVKIAPLDRDKSAFTSPFGTYRFKVMSFGLKTAPQTFTRLMDRFQRSLPGILLFSYLDDIIVLLESLQQHQMDLENVFNKLDEFCLRANRSKCRFGCDSVEYLGHLITPEGLKPNPANVETIINRKNPHNAKELLSFVQTASWYRHFIKDFSRIAKPLSDLLKSNALWTWKEPQQQAYDSLKKALTTPPILQQADENKPFIIKTDASQYALRAALLQGETEKGARPIDYASRLLTPTECNYGTTDHEALCIVWAVEKFRGYIQDNQITIFLDHQPLKYLMKLKSAEGRLARYNLRLQPFDITIEYRPGKTNHLADMLSRPILENGQCESHAEKNIFSVTINLPHRSVADVRKEQCADPDVRKIMNSFENPHEDPIDVSRWTERGFLMNQGLLYRYFDGEEAQLVVPKTMIPEIMKQYHDVPTAGHYGADKTLDRLVKRYYWPGMRNYVTEYVRKCDACQRYKPTNQKPAGLLQTPVPSQRFETISMDLFGPLVETESGNKWILTIMDTATKWMELFALTEATSFQCAKKLVEEFCFRYGVPRRVISDRGVQFVSEVMQYVTECLGLKQHLTSAYHPEGNPIERRHRDLKTQLSILVEREHRSWDKHLSAVRFAMNTVKHDSTGYASAYLVFGATPRSPDDVYRDFRGIIQNENFIPEITPYLDNLARVMREVRENVETNQDRNKKYADQHRQPAPSFKKGDKVLVKTHFLSKASKGITAKFEPRRDGPYLICGNKGPATYLIATPQEPAKVIGQYHASDLTPFRGEEDSIPIHPIRSRGRPKSSKSKQKKDIVPKRGDTITEPTPVTPTTTTRGRVTRKPSYFGFT